MVRVYLRSANPAPSAFPSAKIGSFTYRFPSLISAINEYIRNKLIAQESIALIKYIVKKVHGRTVSVQLNLRTRNFQVQVCLTIRIRFDRDTNTMAVTRTSCTFYRRSARMRLMKLIFIYPMANLRFGSGYVPFYMEGLSFDVNHHGSYEYLILKFVFFMCWVEN